MQIKELDKRASVKQNKKLETKFNNFVKLISELNKRELPQEVIEPLNGYIEEINRLEGTDKALLKFLRNTQPKILNLLETKAKLAPKNYYRLKWLTIGLSVFGISFGVAFGTAFGNMAFISLGIPVGMAIGIGYGTSLDKKALKEGNQLDVEMSY